jgi:Zinc carboxypeptidase
VDGKLRLTQFPFGNDCQAHAKDFDVLLKGSQIAAEALKSVNGLAFKYGPICQTIYQASGGSADAMYDAGVKYSYTAELRDKGLRGFLLPADQIVPSGKEVTKAMFALYNFIIDTEKL